MGIVNWNSEPTSWLVSGLIPENDLILILGKPSSGKSWITEQLAICIAAGKTFVGEFRVKTREVIMYDEDSPTNIFRRRMSRLARGYGLNIEDLPIEAHSNEGFLLFDDQKRHELIDKVRTMDRPVVMLDSLGKITERRNLNNTSEGTLAAACCNEIRDAGGTVFTVHHMSLKKEVDIRDLDTSRLALGNTMIVAGCDTDISIFNLASDEFIIKPHGKRTKLRVKEPFAVKIREDRRGTWARLILLEEAPNIPSDNAKAIFSLFFSDRGVGLTVESISNKIKKGLSNIDIRETLRELVNERVLVTDNKAHNKFFYIINPDFLNKNSLTTSYWDILRNYRD